MAPSKKLSKAAKLKTLYRRRSIIFHSAELIQTFDNDFLPDQANQLVVRIQHLDELWREFQVIQDQIEDLDEPEEEFCVKRRVFLNQYFALKASLTSKVPPTPPLLPPPAVIDPTPAQPVPTLRLPEIKLGEFSGRFDEWESFSDLFISLVHSNPQLTVVQKLYYLRASVTGEAARMIAPLDLTANNYLVAWNMLKDRFENKHMLIKRHMVGLLFLSPLRKESASGLFDLADEFDRHVQFLDKLEDAEDHWNSFLVERLSSYLDPISIREWETQSAGEIKPTYKQLMDFIHKRSRILQTLTLSHPIAGSQSENKPMPCVFSAHASISGTAKCTCCKQQHLLFQCEKFQSLSPHERFSVAKRNGLCINCLKRGHLAKDCSSGTCKTCAKKHHSMLHFPPPTSAINRLRKPVPQSSFADSNRSQNRQTLLRSVKGSQSEKLLEASPPASSFRKSADSARCWQTNPPENSFRYHRQWKDEGQAAADIVVPLQSNHLCELESGAATETAVTVGNDQRIDVREVYGEGRDRIRRNYVRRGEARRRNRASIVFGIDRELNVACNEFQQQFKEDKLCDPDAD